MQKQLASIKRIQNNTKLHFKISVLKEGTNYVFYHLKRSHDMLQILCSKEKYCTLAAFSYKSFANVN